MKKVLIFLLSLNLLLISFTLCTYSIKTSSVVHCASLDESEHPIPHDDYPKSKINRG